jgi:hypothetical protein
MGSLSAAERGGRKEKGIDAEGAKKQRRKGIESALRAKNKRRIYRMGRLLPCGRKTKI